MKTATLCRLARMGIAGAGVAALGPSCGGMDPTEPVDSGTTEVPTDTDTDTETGDTDTDTDTGTDTDTDTGTVPVPGPLDTTGGFEAPTSPTGGAGGLPSRSAFRALQMNLCNSGVAGCYEGGQSIPEGRGVITDIRPDVVTVNEICEDDVVAELFPAMIEAWPGDGVFWVFEPAESRSSGGPITCTDGQRYGVGILGHVPAASWAGFAFEGARLANQSGDNEMRAWACASATDNYHVCATHLENDNGDVALAQCEELMDPIVPQHWGAHGGPLPTLVGGDMNLEFGGNPDVQDCVPPGWYRKGDGDVQHIMVTNDFTFVSTEAFSMRYTDHDAWLVRYLTP